MNGIFPCGDHSLFLGDESWGIFCLCFLHCLFLFSSPSSLCRLTFSDEHQDCNIDYQLDKIQNHLDLGGKIHEGASRGNWGNCRGKTHPECGVLHFMGWGPGLKIKRRKQAEQCDDCHTAPRHDGLHPELGTASTDNPPSLNCFRQILFHSSDTIFTS